MSDDRDNSQSYSEALKRFTFFGGYDHSIDAKGRIIIPTAYREPLGETFTVSVTRDGEAIALYPDAVFDEMLFTLSKLNQLNRNVLMYQAYLAKMSFRGQQADSQGRLLLPMKLRQQLLKDAKDVEISGAMDHIRIEDRSSANAMNEFFNQNRFTILDEIAAMGKEI